MQTTWRELISKELRNNGEDWDCVVDHTMADSQLDVEFDDGYGIERGCPFTLWTKDRVYFPVVYDGSEWVASVSRVPDGHPTRHVGGG